MFELGERGRPGRVGHQRKDGQRDQLHNPLPELQAHPPHGVEDAEQSRLVFDPLQGEAVNRAKDDHRRHVVFRDRADDVFGNHQFEHLHRTDSAARRDSRDRRMGSRYAEADEQQRRKRQHPRQHVDDPSAMKQRQRLIGPQAPQSVQQRRDDIRIHGRLQQHHIG